MAIKDLQGKHFGMLKVVMLDHVDKRYGAIWKCECECGNTITVRSNDLHTLNTRSCGCFKKASRYGRQTIDLTGKRSGRLIAKEYRGVDNKGRALWYCECDCGGNIVAKSHHLVAKYIKSCGCLIFRGHTVKNASRSVLYNKLRHMKERCYNVKDKGYANYGGRGIYVCDEWNIPGDLAKSFTNFYEWSMSNGFKNNLSIERIDNDGPYSPTNCRWATNKEQSINKRNTLYLDLPDRRITLIRFCEEYNIPRSKLCNRLASNWSINAIVYACNHPDLGIRKLKHRYCDKDGFNILIPKLTI